MQTVAYLLPKRQHRTWSPALEPLDMAAESGVPIPLLGYVTAGQPVEIPQERETVTVPRHMVRKNSYALRVRGHSTIDDHIQDGDIIIVEKRETAENGERVTLKRFYVEPDLLHEIHSQDPVDPKATAHGADLDRNIERTAVLQRDPGHAVAVDEFGTAHTDDPMNWVLLPA